ncbi:Hsp70 family protein [Anaeromyxobacter diazotrophicus]|uniref:Chaperone protein DnaK n=1 Tax=Anaeromyxobacter diazotrophicus TaxID=2590199 RepID=A0A7I9VN01_9BACT|nr:Hsp70 family protein [Anaeromyxobacter diazotrophicus]GEJ57357.1 chaperone protein DnaK [Anaeromyxobacter diazotrophicus]
MAGAPPREKPILGIDLGTTNTCVAHVRNRIPRVVPTDKGSLVLPSVVALSDRGEFLVGGVAKDQMVTNPKKTIYGAKRLIGRKFNSVVVQELRSYYSYDIVEGPNGEAAVALGDEVRTLPQVSALVLEHVKKIAEAFLGRPMGEAVISVPAYYNDNQRQAVKEAGRLAGFEVKRIVNEPTAAALAYGFNRGLDQKILVYDLGGGTFDVSVLQLNGNVFEVLATGGDTFLGGADFDNRIIDYALEAFWRDHKIDLAGSPIAMQRIKGAAEAAKIDLTLIPHASLELPFIEEKKGRPLDLRLPLSRSQLDELTVDLVDRTFQICDQVLAEKGLQPSQIDEIILVGGQSRMPLVQEKIRQHFGKPPRKGVHPDECVALGAALLGDSLDQIDSVTLVDVLSMPIGVGTPQNRFRRLLEKNNAIPCSRSFRLPPPREPGQPIELDIYQGDSDDIVDDEFLGSIRLPAAATGRRVDFKLDEECLLKVVFDDPEQGMRQVDFATRDTPEALRRALAERAARHGAEPSDPEVRRGGGLFGWLRRGA